MWIDSHCHLNHENFEGRDPSEIAAEALAGDIDGMITICCEIAKELDQLIEIASKHDNVWCSIGTHPHDAGAEAEKAITLEELVRLAKSSPKIVGIGESGLDYFYNHSSPEDQQASFRKHIRACIETDLPLIVHSRDAEEDTMRIIREEGAGTNLRGVMHCFSSKPILAEEALDFGFYISFSGIVTFKRSEELREVAKKVPLDRILVETDAPFLAPVPHRGKVNHPSYTALTGNFLADLREIDASLFAKQTTENFYALFKGAQKS